MSKQKKDTVNKSAAIRDVFLQNPKATAKEVVEILAQKQVAVKPGLVYMIKGRLAQMKSHSNRKAARVATAGKQTGNADPVALIVKIKGLAKEAGGMRNLMALVTVLAD
jgi:uncharacterized NAD(P)/FAD-binding protein YdhS